MPPEALITVTALPLALGSTGPEVAEMQRRLRAAGCDTASSPAGVFDEATRDALLAYQTARGLIADGRCDADTWTALVESEHHLGDRLLCLRSPMMRGDDVADLQLRLGALGFDAGRVDGIFGPDTQTAVADFQRNAGLVMDSVCGPDTVAALVRLEGRAGTASVTAVRERDRLRRTSRSLAGLRVAVGSAPSGNDVAARLGAALQDAGAAVALVQGEWSTQAQEANDRSADAYIGIELLADAAVEAAYFAVPGFESDGGRRLAELVVSEVPAAPGWGIGSVKGMRLPILRETRCPAVLLRVGQAEDLRTTSALLVPALVRALDGWAAQPC